MGNSSNEDLRDYNFKVVGNRLPQSMQPIVSTLTLQELASGDRVSLQVYKFLGKSPGKKVYIQANLHGAEIIGNAVIHQLINFLTALDSSELSGEVWLVPLCNPLSTNQRNHFFSTGRYNPYDGTDWNRIFWDYEKECQDLESFAKSQLSLSPAEIRSNYFQKIHTTFQKQIDKIQSSTSVPYTERYSFLLQSLCLDANYVIDIHSSSNQGIDYLFCFQSREESAKYFGIDYGILMNEYEGDAFDEAFMKPWLALEKQMAKLGRDLQLDVESWTLELGSGMTINPASLEKGVSGIINYLRYKEILEPPFKPLSTTEIKLVEKSHVTRYYAPTGGMIYNRVSLGSMIKADEPLYKLICFPNGDSPTTLKICAEKGGLVFDLSTNEGVNQGEYVLTIMEGLN